MLTPTSPSNRHSNAIAGCLLGTAIGDALGLWCEGISPRRQQLYRKDPGRYHFLCGRGMVSDDTEHACMTAQALIASAGDEATFVRDLAWRLRWWLLRVPAGIGLATLRATLKLWIGFPPSRSGVFSAGNGPAMRSPLLGVCYGDQPDKLRRLVHASTQLTHTDPKAEHGALAVALAAHLASREPAAADLGAQFLQQLRGELPDAESFHRLLERAVKSAECGQATEAFALELGLANGVSGYIYHTAPVVIQAWLRHRQDFRAGLTAVIRCGGDSDTTAAILGGILGAAVGKSGLPADLLAGLFEWPCTPAWIADLAERLQQVLESGEPARPPRLFMPAVMLRNLVFLIIVLLHGFRRLLPPW